MSDTDIRRLVRLAGRRAHFPAGAGCAACGEQHPIVLVEGTEPLRCYECAAAAAGRSTREAHHVIGRRLSPVTVTIPANLHRLLNDRQADWPKEARMNPEPSPLSRMATALDGFLDILRECIDRVVGWIPRYLRDLDGAMVTLHGPQWWTKAPFDAVFVRMPL